MTVRAATTLALALALAIGCNVGSVGDASAVDGATVERQVVEGGGAGGATVVSKPGAPKGKGGKQNSNEGDGGSVGSGGAQGSGGKRGGGNTGGTQGGSGGAQGSSGGTQGSSGGAQGSAGKAGSGGAQGSGGKTGSGGTPGTVTYSTNFDLTESPISEGGKWITGNDPLSKPVFTANGVAFGTQAGTEFKETPPRYNDSQAYLAGTWPANQRGTAVIHKVTGNIGKYQEVEILLRWSVGALRTSDPPGGTHSYGYECNLAYDGQYAQIGHFLEGAGLFDSLKSGSPITSLGVQDGDTFGCEITGNKITSFLIRNGVTTVLGTATDPNPIASGTPGIGYYRGTESGFVTTPQDYAFTSFTATSL